MPTTYIVTERPERNLDMAAVRNNLLYAVRERKYKREFNVWASTSRVTLPEVTAAVDVNTGLTIPQIGASYPHDSLAVCIKVSPSSTGADRKYFRVVCEYDTSWVVNAITDNPLNQLPEITWSGPGYERAMRRDYFGVTLKNSSGYPFDPVITIDDKRALLRIVRNEATFNEAYARLWRKKLNQTSWGGADSLQARINTIEGTNYVSNGVVFWQVTYEIEFREYPDAFISYVQDLGYFDKNQVAFPDPYTGMPLANPTPLNGRGGNMFKSRNSLSVAINSSVTSFTVPATTHNEEFPPGPNAPNGDGIVIGPHYWFQIKVEDEIMNVTNVTSGFPDVTYTVERGYAGTDAAAHAQFTEFTLEPYFLRFIPHGYAKFDDLGLPVV